MADKDQVTSIKDDVQEENTSQNNSEDYVNERVKEYLGEDDNTNLENENEKDTESTDSVEDTSESESKEDTKNEPEEKEQPEEKEDAKVPEIDEEKISQKVANQLIEKLTGDKKKDREQAPWEKEGRNPTYTEALDYVSKQTEKRVLEKVEQREKAKTEEQQKAQQEYQKRLEDTNKLIDTQLSQLRERDEIPKADTDEGKKVEQDILNKLMIHNQKNPDKAYNSITEFYFMEYKPTRTKQPEGAKAPVSSGSGASTGSNTFNYEDIHNARSYEDIINGQ